MGRDSSRNRIIDVFLWLCQPAELSVCAVALGADGDTWVTPGAWNAMQKAPAFAGSDRVAGSTLALMEPQQISPSLVVGLDGTAVTDDGLVVKNVARAENIRSRQEARIDASFASWQVCRLVRRDFNFVVTKMFHRGNTPVIAEQLRSLTQEFRLQAELFADDIAHFAENPVRDMKVVPLRLFSAYAGGMYRAMLIADAAYARLNHSYANNDVSYEDYQTYSRGFEIAWANIKNFLNNGLSGKSAEELGAEQGIA